VCVRRVQAEEKVDKAKRKGEAVLRRFAPEGGLRRRLVKHVLQQATTYVNHGSHRPRTPTPFNTLFSLTTDG
jgi:hypothetical protein